MVIEGMLESCGSECVPLARKSERRCTEQRSVEVAREDTRKLRQ